MGVLKKRVAVKKFALRRRLVQPAWPELAVIEHGSSPTYVGIIGAKGY
jgi:hypothetical protein